VNGEAVDRPPHGVDHHFAPLALVGAGTALNMIDCRSSFGFLAT
jgi:hypothetical protein